MFRAMFENGNGYPAQKLPAVHHLHTHTFVTTNMSFFSTLWLKAHLYIYCRMVKAEYASPTAPVVHVVSWTLMLSSHTGNPHTAVATDTHWASDFHPGWAQTPWSDTQTLQYIMQDTTASQYPMLGATHKALSFKCESFESKVMLIIWMFR